MSICETASHKKLLGLSLKVESLNRCIAILSVYKLLTLKGWIEMLVFVAKIKSEAVTLQPWELSGCNLKLALWIKGRERWKKEAGDSRLVGGRFNKKGNLHTRLVSGSRRQADLCTCPLKS